MYLCSRRRGQAPTKARANLSVVAPILGVTIVLGGLLLLSGQAAALTQGFKTKDSSLKPGMVAALSPESTNSNQLVQAADSKLRAKIVGVVSNLGSDLLSVAPAGSTIYVTQTGTAKAYVSDINGAVNKGDSLSVSPLRGILMRTGDSANEVIAVALADASGAVSQSVNVKDSDGNLVNAQLALIDSSLDIKQTASTGAGTGDKNVLQNLGKSITGKDINQLRVLAALAIFGIMLATEGAIIHGIVVSSISAVGRNPLAAGLISKQSVRSAGYGIAIFMVFLAMMFMVLLL